MPHSIQHTVQVMSVSVDRWLGRGFCFFLGEARSDRRLEPLEELEATEFEETSEAKRSFLAVAADAAPGTLHGVLMTQHRCWCSLSRKTTALLKCDDVSISHHQVNSEAAARC